jgi:Rieske Fe-S protein
MDKPVNGWTVLLVVILMAMGYAFGVYNVKTLMPAASAQIAANDKVVGDVNKAYQQMVKQVNDAFTAMDKRVKDLEGKSATKPGK